MNYLAITKNDMLNGDGLRVVLWVAGCSHECEGCHNPHTHNPNSGELFTDKQKYEIFQELAKDHISGITFSGGDPLHPNNRTEVIEFAKEIKETFPDQTIWLYTGYRFESILRSSFAQILDYVDVMVDGRFSQCQKSNSKHWAGSKNQRVINVKSSIVNKTTIVIE